MTYVWRRYGVLVVIAAAVVFVTPFALFAARDGIWPDPEESVCKPLAISTGATLVPDPALNSEVLNMRTQQAVLDYDGDDQAIVLAIEGMKDGGEMADGTSATSAMWGRCEALGYPMIDWGVGSALDQRDLISGLDTSGLLGPSDGSSADIDCSDVSGPFVISGDDPNGLDADGDNVACE